MKFYLNGKKITKKAAQLLCGERFNSLIKIAKEDFAKDPNIEISFMVSGGILNIEMGGN